MADEKYTLTQVLEAIRGSAGIKATIMRRLNCSRNTVDNYLNRYATAQTAYDDEVELIGDAAESVIIQAIRNSDVDTAKWYAKVKLKNRGYGDGPSGSADDPIHHMTYIKEVRPLQGDPSATE